MEEKWASRFLLIGGGEGPTDSHDIPAAHAARLASITSTTSSSFFAPSIGNNHRNVGLHIVDTCGNHIGFLHAPCTYTVPGQKSKLSH